MKNITSKAQVRRCLNNFIRLYNENPKQLSVFDPDPGNYRYYSALYSPMDGGKNITITYRKGILFNAISVYALIKGYSDGLNDHDEIQIEHKSFFLDTNSRLMRKFIDMYRGNKKTDYSAKVLDQLFPDDTDKHLVGVSNEET